MRCPKCKTDVPDGHSYCTKCRTLLYDYSPDDGELVETAVSRAGKRLFDLLILVVLIAGGIVLGRAIQWKQILTGFQPATAVSPSPKQGKQSASHQSSPKSREKSEDSSRPSPNENKSEKNEQAAPTDETRPTLKPDPMKKKDGR